MHLISLNTMLMLCIATCGYKELVTTINDSIIRVISDNRLPVEGSTITFNCPPGMEQIGLGSNSATCTDNGEWELRGTNGLIQCTKSNGNNFVIQSIPPSIS